MESNNYAELYKPWQFHGGYTNVYVSHHVLLMNAHECSIWATFTSMLGLVNPSPEAPKEFTVGISCVYLCIYLSPNQQQSSVIHFLIGFENLYCVDFAWEK